MAYDVANLQGIVPLNIQLSFDRLNLVTVPITGLVNKDGGVVNLDPATTFQLWTAVPDPAQPVPVFVQTFVPTIPIAAYEISPGGPNNNVLLQLVLPDFNALNIWFGQAMQFSLLCSKDGGDTPELVASGTLTCKYDITSTWS